MSLETVIQENTNALQQLIALLSDPSALKIASAPVAATEQKKEKPPAEKKSNGAAQTAAAESKITTAAATSGETQTETASVIDYETVKAAVIKLSQAKGREVVVDVLSRFGVQKAPDLMPTQYADALAKIQSVIDGGAV